MKKTVVLSQMIHPLGYAMIEDKFNVIVPENLSQEAFDKVAVKADAIVLRTNVRVSGEVIRSAPNLRIISRTGAGVDNIDQEACREKGVLICNLPSTNNVSVAEHAVSMMATLAKRLPQMDDGVRKEDGWQIRSKNLPVELEGKTLGVIGLGAIGAIAARICCEGFGMKVLAYDPFVDPVKFPKYKVTSDLATVFGHSDFVTIHCPSLPSTRGMINREILAVAKPGAILVNCARGDVIDTDALYEALKDGRIAAAGLDVFEQEPPDVSDKLLTLDNVIVSPHSAALTKEASARMSTDACRQVIQYFETGEPIWIYGDKKIAVH